MQVKQQIGKMASTIQRMISVLSIYTIIYLLFLSLPKQVNAQSDSLKKKLVHQKGLEKLKTIKNLADEYNSLSEYDSALIYERIGLKEATQLNNQKYLAVFHSAMGVTYWNRAEHKLAIACLQKAEKISIKIKDNENLSAIYNNLGLVYFEEPNYPKALFYLDKALTLAKERKDKSSEASAVLNIGLVYDDSKQFIKALDYYKQALKLAVELKEEETQMICYGNMGGVYDNIGKRSEAMNFQIKSLNIAEKLKNKRGMALANNNIGAMLFDQKKYNEAQLFYDQAYHLYHTIKDLNGIVLVLNNLGNINGIQGKYREAIRFYEEAMTISDTAELIDHLSTSYKGLADTYAEMKEYGKAYYYQVAYKQNEDTLSAMRNLTTVNEMKTKFEVHQKEQELNSKQEKERAVNEANRKQQTIVIVFIIVLLGLTVLFSAFLYKRIKISTKQNRIIKEQKHLVEEKNKEITDSINYAKRIQYALLAHESLLKEHVPQHFVFFKPKDIVSGDFYWATTTQHGSNGQDEKSFYLAVADSTGHGVPGAFMSLLNISFLNEAITEKKIYEPHAVLNHVRTRLIENISQEGAQDGMDGILIRIIQKKDGRTVQYAAANNAPLLIQNSHYTELPCDKMPVGKGEVMNPFTLHELKTQTGDVLILYTDGYADQFGGKTDEQRLKGGKKYKYKQLNELLALHNKDQPETIKSKLEHEFNNWKGTLEQVDDVCIIGITF